MPNEPTSSLCGSQGHCPLNALNRSFISHSDLATCHEHAGTVECGECGDMIHIPPLQPALRQLGNMYPVPELPISSSPSPAATASSMAAGGRDNRKYRSAGGASS